MKYFSKISPRSSFYLKNGRPLAIQVNNADPDYGYVAVGNQEIVDEIEFATKQGIGGFTEITQGQYEEGLKKKPIVSSDLSSALFRQQTLQSHPSRQFEPLRNVVVGDSQHPGNTPVPVPGIMAVPTQVRIEPPAPQPSLEGYRPVKRTPGQKPSSTA